MTGEQRHHLASVSSIKEETWRDSFCWLLPGGASLKKGEKVGTKMAMEVRLQPGLGLGGITVLDIHTSTIPKAPRRSELEFCKLLCTVWPSETPIPSSVSSVL